MCSSARRERRVPEVGRPCGGLNAQLGSEVHVYPDEVWPECMSSELYSIPPISEDAPPVSTAQNRIASKSVELVFRNPASSLITVLPNPCTEFVMVSITESSGQYHIRDSNGARVGSGPIVSFPEVRPVFLAGVFTSCASACVPCSLSSVSWAPVRSGSSLSLPVGWLC